MNNYRNLQVRGKKGHKNFLWFAFITVSIKANIKRPRCNYFSWLEQNRILHNLQDLPTDCFRELNHLRMGVQQGSPQIFSNKQIADWLIQSCPELLKHLKSKTPTWHWNSATSLISNFKIVVKPAALGKQLITKNEMLKSKSRQAKSHHFPEEPKLSVAKMSMERAEMPEWLRRLTRKQMGVVPPGIESC